MKRAALCLLGILVLLPAVAFAQSSSLDSMAPTSFYSFEFEQNATLHGVDLFGDFYGAPDSDNIFLSTQLLIDGPAGTFTRDISGGFRQINTFNDTIFMAIPDETLLVEGHYSVSVIAHDDTGDRVIGPVFYDVVRARFNRTRCWPSRRTSSPRQRARPARTSRSKSPAPASSIPRR